MIHFIQVTWNAKLTSQYRFYFAAIAFTRVLGFAARYVTYLYVSITFFGRFCHVMQKIDEKDKSFGHMH